MRDLENWRSELAKGLAPLKLRYPFIQGGMGNISSPELCAAVSQAGGLGQISAGDLPIEQVEAKLKRVKALLGEKYMYGLNIPLSVHPHVNEVMELVYAYNVPVVTLSAGNPRPWTSVLKRKGIIVMVVVSSVRQAKKAEESKADIIVAEGFEAAGKNSPKELTTMTLLPQVASVVRCPVVAAGGIGNGRGFLAALALGAQGVQMGTRLMATEEAGVHANYQRALLDSGDEDTIVVGRRYGRVVRLLNTAYAQQVAMAERNGISEAEFLSKLDEESHYRGAILGQLDKGHVNAGQICGAIKDIIPVKVLFERMMEEAYQGLLAISKGVVSFGGSEVDLKEHKAGLQ